MKMRVMVRTSETITEMINGIKLFLLGGEKNKRLKQGSGGVLIAPCVYLYI